MRSPPFAVSTQIFLCECDTQTPRNRLQIFRFWLFLVYCLCVFSEFLGFKYISCDLCSDMELFDRFFFLDSFLTFAFISILIIILISDNCFFSTFVNVVLLRLKCCVSLVWLTHSMGFKSKCDCSLRNFRTIQSCECVC